MIAGERRVEGLQVERFLPTCTVRDSQELLCRMLHLQSAYRRLYLRGLQRRLISGPAKWHTWAGKVAAIVAVILSHHSHVFSRSAAYGATHIARRNVP